MADLPETIRRKAERMRRARSRSPSLWRSILHVGSLGWLFVIPIVLGAVLGHLLGRWTGLASLAVAPMLAGLAAGGYAVWVRLKKSARDDDEEADSWSDT